MLINFIIIAIFAILIIRFINYIWFIYSINSRLKWDIGPRRLPIIGNILLYKNVSELLQVNLKLMLEFGGIFRIRLGPQIPSLIITDLDHVQFLLSSNKIIEKSYVYWFLRNWLGYGLLTSSGEKWQQRRKLITPTFHFQILEQFIQIFNTKGDILVKQLKCEAEKDCVDVYPYVSLCTLDIISESAMGIKMNTQLEGNSKYIKSVKDMGDLILRRIILPFKVHEFIYYLSFDHIKEKILLRTLHGTTKAVFEGHDTTSSGISFALYALSKQPAIQAKIVEELKQIFGEDRTRHATYQDLQDMKYLEMVIKESLRLYPPVPVIGRLATEDFECNGVLYPTDLDIQIFIYGIHRNPEIYPDPSKFDPERFTLENQAKRHPFAHIPFSAGPRNCIGQKFAMLELKSTISKVLRNYELLPIENYEPKLTAELTLKSLNGVKLKLKHRV